MYGVLLATYETMKTGFTLIEVVVAAALMALALSAFMATFVMARRSSETANDRMEAVHIARRHMERAICYGYYNAALTYGAHSLETITNGYGVYSAQYTITTNNLYALVKDIAMRVSWQPPLISGTNSITLHSSISQGLHP